MKPLSSSQNLAATITCAASKQTYYTVRFLVDNDRVADAYRAYAYFRWLDDQLDRHSIEEPERKLIVDRQSELVRRCYRGEWPRQPSQEERMLVDLIRGDRDKDSGLRAYIAHMMAVMAFDARRRGQLVSQKELTRYSRNLAIAVTEALHYFIGHRCAAPRGVTRYLAARGAHITHMLRDTLDDLAAGYYNIPAEYLQAHGIAPHDVDSDACRAWVRDRVGVAHHCFAAGKSYLAQVHNLRCRIAGYAYIARFEGVLAAIERDGYQLRAAYPEYTCLPAKIKAGGWVLWQAIGGKRSGLVSPAAKPSAGES